MKQSQQFLPSSKTILSFYSQRGKTLMKSRFLTSAIAFMVLGLFSSNLFGQITSSSSVDFEIMSAVGGWRTSSDVGTRPDTVGRSVKYRVIWESGSQYANLTKYTVTLPVGTITDTATLKNNVLMQLYEAGGNPINITLASTQIAITAANELSDYSASTVPQIVVTADRNVSTYNQYTLTFDAGLSNPLYVSSNTKLHTASELQKFMVMSFNHNETSPGTFRDSSFFVTADKADKVVYNTLVTGYIDAANWPSGDSIYFTDQWGNINADFMTDVDDSLLISVASDQGTFTAIGNPRAGGAYLDSVDLNTIKIMGDATNDANIYSLFADQSAVDTIITTATPGTGGEAVILHQLVPTDSAANAIVIYFGEYDGLTNDNSGHPAGLGLKFDAEETTTLFTFTIAGPNAASDSIIGAAPTGVTTMTRNVYPATVGSEIGTLTLAMDFGPHYNGLALTGTGLTVTLLDVFGDNHEGDIGTDTDSILITFQYWTDGAVDTDMTDMMVSGGEVTSIYSRPVTRLIESTYFRNGSSGGSKLIGGTLASGSLTLSGGTAPIYLGTTSHPDADSIIVTASAFNTPTVSDTAVITVEPSPPVAFDLDGFKDSIATVDIVKGATVPIALPLFALDTAYNLVTNMDLTDGGNFLDDITIDGNTGIPAINFLINSRDPVGYMSTTVTDSILFDNAGTRGTAEGAAVMSDSSFIWDYDVARVDSSVINIGGVGVDPLGMRLLYQGLNYKLTINWDPGTAGGYAAGDFTSRSLDLGLFTLGSPTLIDSVDNVTVISTIPDSAGARSTLTISFDIPQGNSLNPNTSDSLVYIKFLDMPDGAGIPATITADSVRFSTEANANYYAILGFELDGDSIAAAVPQEYNATQNAVTCYVRIYGFMMPNSVADSVGVRITTSASLVPATILNAIVADPDDNDIGGLVILPPGATCPAAPLLLSEAGDSADAASDSVLIAGTAYLFKLVLGDMYGNVGNYGAGSRVLVLKGPDSTALGYSTDIAQVFDGVSTAGTDAGMYDTLEVDYDQLASGDYSIVDSLMVTPSIAGTYSLTVMDTTTATSDMVTITVIGSITDSLVVVSPTDTVASGENTEVAEALTVKLLDVYGNALPDSIVRFTITGVAALTDSNGTTVATADSTSILVAADDAGQASVGITTGITNGDLVVVTADVPSNSNVTAMTFNITTNIVNPTDTSQITFKDPPDATVQDTSAGVTITADIRDNNLIAKAYLRAITTVLEMDAGVFTATAMSDTAMVDSMIYSTPDDSVNFAKTIPAGMIWDDSTTGVVYDLLAVDADGDSVWSDQGEYMIGPMTGKADLTADDVKLGDVLRTVYLFLNAEGIVYRAIDYIGLDIDGDLDFTMSGDVLAVLALWRGDTTSAALASAAQQEARTATVSMAYAEVDKANGTLDINLENQGNLTIAGFRVKYDTDKYVFGEVQATERLKGLEVYFSNNETEGVYSVAVVNINGGLISTGGGSILSIPISAVGEKFDGDGEISLMLAQFDAGVTSNIDGGVLSPQAILPKAFALSQNYPNPFNPSTTIAFDIPADKETQVRLNVYNIRGQLVRTLVNETMDEGSYKIEWNGKDNSGRFVASGVYFYRIQADEFSKTRKMVILK
jgi:FlgD Ig-like domain